MVKKDQLLKVLQLGEDFKSLLENEGFKSLDVWLQEVMDSLSVLLVTCEIKNVERIRGQIIFITRLKDFIKGKIKQGERALEELQKLGGDY